MVNISLPDEIAHRLEEYAQRENRSVADVVSEWLDEHTPIEQPPKKGPNWDLILGIGEEDVTDMSTTVRETLQEHFKKKYGSPD